MSLYREDSAPFFNMLDKHNNFYTPTPDPMNKGHFLNFLQVQQANKDLKMLPDQFLPSLISNKKKYLFYISDAYVLSAAKEKLGLRIFTESWHKTALYNYEQISQSCLQTYR